MRKYLVCGKSLVRGNISGKLYSFSGGNSCQSVLLQINKRYHLERELVSSTLQKSGKNLSDAIHIEYCRLMRQLMVLEEETNFVAIATAVGLAERDMEPRPDR